MEHEAKKIGHLYSSRTTRRVRIVFFCMGTQEKG